MKYDLLIFIGRFQPLHLGHQEVIERARLLSKRVLVLVGSTDQARSARNPFTFLERYNMIKRIYPDVLVHSLRDHTYNDTAWITEVQEVVHKLSDGAQKIGLIGCEKDHTSYYLKMFPDWDNEAIEFVNPLNATAIRKMLYEDQAQVQDMAAIMHLETARWLFNEYKNSLEYAEAVSEYHYLQDYKEKWGEGPFLTADALVQVGGKILLIERGKEYGNGLLALPGGFLNQYERFRDGAIRELREETRLRVPVPVLHGSIKASRVFDDPHRSERGRLVTECYHISLENDTSLPEVRGSDDAARADWYDIAWIKESRQRFFEDHYHIIKVMLGLN